MNQLRTYFAHFALLQRNARLFLLSNLLINLTTGAVPVIYILFLARLGFGTDFQSILLVAGIAGGGLGMLPALRLTNVVSARRLLLWSNIIGGIAAAGQMLIPTVSVLFITSIVLGASAAIYIVLTPPLLTASSSPEERNYLFSINASLGFLTSVLGLIIGGKLPEWLADPHVLTFPLLQVFRPLLVRSDVLPLQLALIVSGLFAIPSILPLALMDDAIIGERAGTGVKAPETGMAVGFIRRVREVYLPELMSLVRTTTVWRFTLYQAWLGLGAGFFLTYISLYFYDRIHLTTGTFGLVSGGLTIALAAATLASPLLAQRFGPIRGPVSSQFLTLPLLLTLALTNSAWLAVPLYLVRGVLMNAGQPAVQSFIMSSIPNDRRSSANLLFTVAFQGTVAIGGVGSGFLIPHVGYTPNFLIATVAYALAMVMLVPWFGREQQLLVQERTLEQSQESAGVI